MPPLASYGDYSATVRGALVWLGKSDPALSMEQARDDDPELGELRDVMVQWMQHIGLNVESTAKALVRIADLKQRDDDTGRQLQDYANPELRDSLSAVAGGRGGIDTARFGRWLRSRKGRIVSIGTKNSMRVRFRTGGLSEGAARWKLELLK